MKTVEERFWAKVQQSDDCWEWTGNKDKNGYGRLTTDGKYHYAHRYSIELATGQQPTQHVDHICHNTSCVNPAHLREVTTKQNMENRGKLQDRNTSGYRGVTLHKPTGKWQARVVHGGKHHFLGYFEDPAEAGEVARAKRNELFTHNVLDRQQQRS